MLIVFLWHAVLSNLILILLLLGVRFSTLRRTWSPRAMVGEVQAALDFVHCAGADKSTLKECQDGSTVGTDAP